MLTAQAAYQFLKPSLEELSEKEKAELCRLINGEPETKKVKKSKVSDPVMSKAKMKKALMKSHFKSKAY